MTIKFVHIVGCGPAGLAAAHAAAGLEIPFSIIAPKKKTPQRGPLLLQRPIPGINTSHPDGYIRQIVIGGSILRYREKLYGDINININGDVLADGYHAWKFPETYDKLWDLYSGMIENTTADADLLSVLSGISGQLVVNTAPMPQFCEDRHHVFASASVLVSPVTGYPDQPDNTIIFNASDGYYWSRSSLVFGVPVSEFAVSPHNRRVAGNMGHGNPARLIQKPISTDCNCHPKVLRTGRFGAWRNETWVDTAYYDVRNAIMSDRNEKIWSSVQ